MASALQSSQQPLRVFGVALQPPRPAQPLASTSAGQSLIRLGRLLTRVERQLTEEEEQTRQLPSNTTKLASIGSEQRDPYRVASIAIALTHASTQAEPLPPGFEVTQLRQRIDAARRRYVALSPLQPAKRKERTAVQEYLVRDVVNDSDTDSEYEAELRNSRAPPLPAANQSADAEDDDKTAPAGGDGDELEEYEKAATLRRRHKSSEEATEVTDEKAADEAPPTALQSERSVQDALSGELLRMAGILKTKAVSFADQLERDRIVIEGAGEKLQGNLTLMTRTRGRLGEYSRKTRSMGWITLGSVAVVCMSWVLMFIVIRLT